MRDGLLYGRGACDMKGGVASMIVAACTLAELGVPLAGDLIVNTVTEEESTGAGGLFAARLLQADAAIVPEPKRPRGLGRLPRQPAAAHHRARPRGPRGHRAAAAGRGGAVNAIEKMTIVLNAVARLRETWAAGPEHRYLSPGDCVPTIIAGGEWLVSYPASCTLECHIEYLPERVDDAGLRLARRARVRALDRAGGAAPTRGSASIRRRSSGASAACRRPRSPRTTRSCRGARRRGPRPRQPAELGGLDNWHDGATLTVEAGIPAVCFGPGDVHRAHTVDEHVPIDDLVACAQRIALAAMRFCGTLGV